MCFDKSRLSRDYELNPLGKRELIPVEDLIYLFIELNYCYEKISKIVSKSSNTISKQCKKYNLIKTKEKQKESIRNYFIETIGVKNPAQLKSAQEKMKNTMLEKYGVENIAHRKETINKRKLTCLRKYGVENPAQLEENQQKMRETNLKRYGKEFAQQTRQVKDKQQNTMLKRYGCKYPLQNKEIKKKQEQTCLERYGVKNPFQNKNIQQKQQNTVKEKYNVSNIAQMEKVIKKGINTKKIKGNLNTSSVELEIEKLLKTKFSDLKTQYNKDCRYPFLCDFYIPRLDLFIEYQGFVSHGEKPYKMDLEYDKKLLKKWWNKVYLFEKKNPLLPLYKCSYYNYIYTWTFSDPLKRETAKENKLNWIEFFNLKDFMEWYNNLEF